ncbi:MAG: BT_3928 family protein [Sphingobacteriaceae bacterium]
MKKFSIAFSRIFVGLLFIFSGLIKANDPLGFSYKLQEYFEVFHLPFFNDYASVIAIFLCGLEIILGAALLLGIYAKKVAWGLLALIVFFTFLTFYSAYFKVVTSCGCFGDAIPLSPWQSFSKDLVLLVFILVVFVYRNQIQPVFAKASLQASLVAPLCILGFGVGVFTLQYGPVLDFLPYKIGNNIPELMVAPPGAPQDEYEIRYTLKNTKTGATKSLTDKEYLKQEVWKDSAWVIVGDPESKLIKKGYEVKIKDLKITDPAGEDFTKLILEYPEYQFIVVAYDLNNTDRYALKRINDTGKVLAQEFRVPTIFLTASSVPESYALNRVLFLDFPFFFADAVPLKSMVRANPGILLLKNGVVLNKWHFRTFPSAESLRNTYFAK